MQTKYLPCEEWNKLSQAQKDALFEKRRKERFGNNKPPMASAIRQANAHLIDDPINLDDPIDLTVMNHKTVSVATTDDHLITERNDDDLLAYMSGRTKSNSGDIRHVLAAKQTPDKHTNRKVIEANSAPSSVQVC